MKRAFTLIELLVVVAMIAVIMGAMTTSVTASRRRAQIAKATAEVKELTNAFLAYENYSRGQQFKLEEKEREEVTADSISFLLGKEKDDNGNTIPVLYNGAVAANKKVLDPWGHPYRFTIRSKTVTPPGNHTLETGYYMPNIYRLSEGER